MRERLSMKRYVEFLLIFLVGCLATAQKATLKVSTPPAKKKPGAVGVPCCQSGQAKGAKKPTSPQSGKSGKSKKPTSLPSQRKPDSMEERIRVLVEQIQVEANPLPARLKAMQDLGALRKNAFPAVKVILYVLKTSKASALRQMATFALADIGGAHPLSMKGLVGALQDKNHGVRECAASALGNLRGEAKKALSALLKASQTKNKNLTAIVAWSLGNIGVSSPAVVKRLIALRQSKDNKTANNASIALKRLRSLEKQRKAAAKRAKAAAALKKAKAERAKAAAVQKKAKVKRNSTGKKAGRLPLKGNKKVGPAKVQERPIPREASKP